MLEVRHGVFDSGTISALDREQRSWALHHFNVRAPIVHVVGRSVETIHADYEPFSRH